MEESGSGSFPTKLSGTESEFQPKFLKAENNFERVVLCSYPRSGNSLLRGLLERVTGIFTGSDTDPRRKLGKDLSEFGLRGEGVVDSRVWITKTHFPERRGYASFKAEKAIVLVRNPFDAIDSLWNMAITGTHTLSVQESEYGRFLEDWERYVEEEIQIWKKFHQFWLASPIPCHIIRYEDLKECPEDALGDLFKFLLNKESVAGTKVGNKITSVISQKEKASVYRPRVGKIYNSLKHFTEGLIKHTLTELRDELRDFGYLNHAFFDHEITRPFRDEFLLGTGTITTAHLSTNEGGAFGTSWVTDHNKSSLERVLNVYKKKEEASSSMGSSDAPDSKSSVATVFKRQLLVVNSVPGVRPKTETDPNQRGQKDIKKKIRPLARIKVEGDDEEEYDEAEVRDA